MTGLEALSRLVDFYNLPSRNPIAYMLEQENLNEYANIIKKELEALEIIKEKKCDIAILMASESLYDYNDYMNCSGMYNEYGNSRKLTQEEYDLLRWALL